MYLHELTASNLLATTQAVITLFGCGETAVEESMVEKCD